LASSSSDATVRLWDLSRPSSNPVVLPHDEATTEVAFSGDGRTLATASVDGTVRLWDARRPTASSLLQGHDEAPVGPVAFSPNGQTLASGSGDLDGPGGTIRFWMTTDALATAVCEQVWRNLTLSEWNLFVGEGMPYETTCRNLPPGEGAPPEGAGVMATPAVALADSPPPSIVQLPT